MSDVIELPADFEPAEIENECCELCGCTIDRHHRVDAGEGPVFFCTDFAPDELTLEELERRAELRRQEEVAAILARWEAMDQPAKPPSRSEPEPYRPAQSTIAAFRHLTSVGDVVRLRAWLGDRAKDAPYLLAMLEGHDDA